MNQALNKMKAGKVPGPSEVSLESIATSGVVGISSGIAGKRAGVARWPLAAHLGEGKLLFQTPLSCGSIHLWKRLQEVTSRKNQEWSS